MAKLKVCVGAKMSNLVADIRRMFGLSADLESRDTLSLVPELQDPATLFCVQRDDSVSETITPPIPMTRAELEGRIAMTLREALSVTDAGSTGLDNIDPMLPLDALSRSLSSVIPLLEDLDSNDTDSGLEIVMENDTTKQATIAQLVLDELYKMLRQSSCMDCTLRRLVKLVAMNTGLYPSGLVLADFIPKQLRYMTSGGNAHLFLTYKGDTQVVMKRVIRPSSAEEDEEDEEDEYYKWRAKLDLREGIMWSCLNHPNILPFLGYCLDYHDPVDGESLYLSYALVCPYMECGEILPYIDVLERTDRPYAHLGVANGLMYLHQLEIAHGDIKPANILINKDGIPQIADLGELKFRDTTLLTAHTTRAFSAIWSAPEVVAEGEAHHYIPTFASDIWSFGCVWLQIFTRRRSPYYPHEQDRYNIRRLHKRRESPTFPAGLKDENSRDLLLTSKDWRAIRRCLAFDPEMRPKAHELPRIVDFDSSWIRRAYQRKKRSRDLQLPDPYGLQPDQPEGPRRVESLEAPETITSLSD
ncbi:kinase-like protein [Panus rudis PR-1116 ss-1]|nr:kinase-like protein [Panus rudis PR-1116 ss-1]